ncbi:iron-sulfur cluster biosynthesis family protein [Bacillus sp. FJAT-42376]|uniref:iron-sulfur cluster biosynthesis family protein n=1 Tax=Bacillus sp. FJAT-42376 TaxID=2014076 RepID=UPI000F50BCFD|nr:iron-sulfur cluster biosynthesis family protein [Bacillus sp. FJAT-42376]AZB43445.1 iron-sulfur cluster biosynthesis family protein [Bacillus sp. FJAT-42376]
MNVTFTEKAMERIAPSLREHPEARLKLKYDTEGCGCVVSGVAALWLVKETEEDDLKIETNFKPVYLEKTKMVFLDENMTVDFLESANTFALKSPSQMLNPRMSLVVK